MSYYNVPYRTRPLDFLNFQIGFVSKELLNHFECTQTRRHCPNHFVMTLFDDICQAQNAKYEDVFQYLKESVGVPEER